MKRCAIFGANGYLASHLAFHLCRRGVACNLFDLQPVARGVDGDYLPCDVLDAAFWAEFDPARYDAVYFFAGLSGVEPSFASPAKFIQVNELGLVNLLETLAPLGERAPKVLFPSSRLVYRGGGEVDESSPLDSKSVYAANKIACEALLSAYRARMGVPYAAFRVCVPYGNLLGNGYSYGTIAFFAKQARFAGEITVYGDGSATRTFTHVSDVCEAAARLAETEAQGVYNVGGSLYTLQQAAECVAARFRAKVANIPWPDAAARVEMGSISFNASKLAAATGLTAYKDLRDCLGDL